jgi:hypothetical protein
MEITNEIVPRRDEQPGVRRRIDQRKPSASQPGRAPGLIYTHVLNKGDRGVRSPIDAL